MQVVTGDATKILDLDGRFIMPGLVDTRIQYYRYRHPFLLR